MPVLYVNLYSRADKQQKIPSLFICYQISNHNSTGYTNVFKHVISLSILCIYKGLTKHQPFLNVCRHFQCYLPGYFEGIATKGVKF